MRFVNYCIPFYSQFVQCPNFFGIGFVFQPHIAIKENITSLKVERFINLVLLLSWPRGKRSEIAKEILMLMVAGRVVNTV